jgi:hypothetical protein
VRSQFDVDQNSSPKTTRFVRYLPVLGSGFGVSRLIHRIRVLLLGFLLAAGRNHGLVYSVGSRVAALLGQATIWQISNYLAGEAFSSLAVPFWNLLARLKKALDHESSQARIDFLTGVLNSRAFDQIATTEIRRSVWSLA